MDKLNILIIEDEQPLQNIYTELAEEIFPHIHLACSIKQAKQILSSCCVDCMLSDNRLPDGEGIHLIEELIRDHIEIPTIIITAYPEKELLHKSINAGILRFLEKPTPSQTLSKALLQLHHHALEIRLNDSLRNHYILSQHTKKTLMHQYLISQRELELISLALHPLENNTIANKMVISSGTVRRHLENIFNKLEINSRPDLRTLIYKLNHATTEVQAQQYF